MIVLDVNVLIAAFREDHSKHAVAGPWLDRTISSPSGVMIPDLVWVGFVRLVTNARVFAVPTPLEAAFEFVDAVRSAPHYRSLPEGQDVLETFRDTCRAAEAAANLVPDSYVASVAIAYDCPVASFDRDFRRFDGLEIVVPA